MYTPHDKESSSPVKSPFKPVSYYLVLDILYVVFSLLYIWGDPDIGNNFLKWVKPIPLWLMIAQLWSLRGVNSHICTVIWGIAFGSLGDILLLIGSFASGPFF